jgi:hypothetical protein
MGQYALTACLAKTGCTYPALSSGVRGPTIGSRFRRATARALVSLGLLLSFTACGTVGAPVREPKGVAMELAVTPTDWPAALMQDVTFKLTLVNRSGAAVRVYTKTSMIAGMVGGAGPIHGLLFRPSGGGATIHLTQIMGAVSGPPGTPPPAAWHEAEAFDLARDAQYEWTIAACWIPSAGTSTLALDTSCTQVRDAKLDHRDALYRSVVASFPNGTTAYEVVAFYHQAPDSGFFEPQQEIHSVSTAVAITAGRR